MSRHLHLVDNYGEGNNPSAASISQKSTITFIGFLRKYLLSTKGAWAVAMIFLTNFGFSQSYNMNGSNITDCSGFFYDSGGGANNYGASESFTTTICSDATSGTHVQLIFSAVDLAGGDMLCFFDGVDASAPALSCSSDFTPGSPFIIQATAANTTGCLTITFNSDGSAEAAGWQADMNCIPSCQTILADLVNSDPIVSPPDTGYIDICKGERVFFYGEGIYPQNGVVYDHSDFTSSFEWDFGDGITGLGPNVSHVYNEAGGYIVQMTITDQFGCTNTNFITQRVRVSPNPTFAILGDLPTQICAGDTINLNAAVSLSDSTFLVGVMPNEGSFPTAGVRSDSLALPDGTGAAYETSIGFSNFAPGQVLSSISDLVSICVVMEHSWLRDLEISIQCPDGTSIILHDFAGQNGGEVFLGVPNEADETTIEPIPGVGYEYCWTPNATNGTWIEYANSNMPQTLPAGDYNSFDPMSDFLGCPLNGEWTIHVQDLWGVDNGFIFEWSIEFDPSLYPNIETFTPQIIDYNWVSNPSIFFETNDSISASPQNAGTASYTFEVEDEFGCAYDTSVFITVLPPTHPDCFSCPEPVQSLQDTSICDGETLQIDAESTTSLGNQDVTFEIFPTYIIGNANHPPASPYASSLEITTINPATITNAQAQICGVCLDLETDFDGDIRLFLKSPSGQLLELSTSNGGAGDNYTNTCFRPSSSVSITSGSAPFTGDFMPEGNWSALNGSTINGTWELLISDAFGTTKFGLLKSWSMCFNTENDVVYEWQPVAGLSCYDCPNPIANPSTNATYVLEISDDYGCNYMDTMMVNVSEIIPAPTNLVCDTMYDGNINFIWDAVSGFSNYLVNINGTGWIPANGINSHLVGGLSNGDEVTLEVQVDVSSTNCNVGTEVTTCTYFLCDISVEIPPNGITSPSCFNTGDGSVIVQAMGNGTGPFQYSIDNNPPQNTGIFNAVLSGNHTIILTDVDGCADTVMFNMPVANPIVVELETDSVDCNGSATGAASVIATGGTGTFVYAWNTSPVQTFDSEINDVVAGQYIVIVTDGNGCQVIETVQIDEPDLLESPHSFTTVSCNEGDDGSITVNPFGGVAPYEFIWSDGQTTSTVADLVAGDYAVTVTDAKGCSIEISQNITEPQAMSWVFTPTDVSCFGGNNGSIDLEMLGGSTPYQYFWGNGSTSQNIAGLSIGTHCVTVTDGNGCMQDTCITLDQPVEISLTMTSVATTCPGNNSDGMATVVAQGGMGSNYTFTWSDNQTNSTAINLIPNNYCVTVTDESGCTATDCVDIGEPAAIIIDSIIATDVLCNGENTGLAEVFVSGGNGVFTYLWSDPLAQFSNPSNSLPQGNYVVIVTDAALCTAIATVFVDEPDVLTTSVNPVDVNCFGGNDGTSMAIPVGGVQPYFYSWNTLPAQMTQEAVSLSMGGYIVTVTDGNGCTTTAISDIQQPATAVEADISQSFIGCFNQNNSEATVIPSGGTGTNYTYEWSNSPTSTTATANNLAEQTYAVTVTDENGCEVISTIAITDLEDIMMNVIQVEPSCFGDTNGQLGINIVTGGIGNGVLDDYNYVWNNGIFTQLNSNLTSGQYIVTITDAQGCSSENVVNLDEPSLIIATAVVTDANCFGSSDGQIEVNANGDFPITTYQWDNNAANQITQTATALAEGNYLVTITDDTNCSIVSSFAINQPTVIQTSFQTEDNPCFGDQVGEIETTTIGGTPDYTYEWSNTNTTNPFTSVDQNLNELFTSIYTVTITDNHGCTRVETIDINSPAALLGTTETDSVICYDDQNGAIFVSPEGGVPPFMYSLDGKDFTSSSTFLGLEIGNYTIALQDRNGCETEVFALVEGPEAIDVDLGDNITINLGDVTHLNSTVSPAGNYIYIWSPEDSLSCVDCPNVFAFGLSNQTTYQLTVEDENGCRARDFINIYVNKDRKVFVPTGFAPNGNELNQLLRTHGEEGTIVHAFRVYSRWGELVYENNESYEINDSKVGWNGTFNGKEMNPAVFVWYLEVEYIDGAKDVYKGHSTLIK